ncbi:hypothetical protein ABIB95_008733 [Bradyrhizobium sp. LA2.1]
MAPRNLLLIHACCIFLAACDDKVLFTPPERGASNVPAPAVADSVVTLVASLPYSTLARMAEEKLPKSSPIGGDGHIACLGVPYVNPGHTEWGQQCLLGVCTDVPQFYGPSSAHTISVPIIIGTQTSTKMAPLRSPATETLYVYPKASMSRGKPAWAVTWPACSHCTVRTLTSMRRRE